MKLKFKVGDKVWHINRKEVLLVVKLAQMHYQVQTLTDSDYSKKGKQFYTNGEYVRELIKLDQVL